MVPARPQTQTQTHSLSHPSDVLRLNRVGSGSQVRVSGAAMVGLLALTCNIGALITIIIIHLMMAVAVASWASAVEVVVVVP